MSSPLNAQALLSAAPDDRTKDVGALPDVEGQSDPAPLTLGAGASSPGRTPRNEARLPYVGIALLCAASAGLGVAADHRFLQRVAPVPQVAFAEQGSVVLEAVLGHPELSSDAARRLVGQSLRSVIEKYRGAGYVVLDVTHSADGQVVVDALPNSSIDITPEMRSAVAAAIARASSAVAPAVASVAPGVKSQQASGAQR